jgi:redox-sensitive bicupin YhaK (pirin superfamily)
LWINQDARFTLGNLDQGFEIDYTLHQAGHGVYVFLIDGSITIEGHHLEKRDAIGVWEADQFKIKATTDAQLLLIEVPMQ